MNEISMNMTHTKRGGGHLIYIYIYIGLIMVMEWGNMVQYEQPTINMKIEEFFYFFFNHPVENFIK